ncbi:CHAT domain-containing protein [Kovacikia minuta CCNUW1]|uniref:CHAT domain-containing protein n=1 Tax=Kovacikia minuta TaxID=2931930 RepID=UPI001CCF80E1|nr:CHAT domain-containing protein [Kovacikia minuta]UBF25613.1 CHAT domain-containing protein [Kovacikia minuta CCNUW1]
MLRNRSRHPFYPSSFILYPFPDSSMPHNRNHRPARQLARLLLFLSSLILCLWIGHGGWRMEGEIGHKGWRMGGLVAQANDADQVVQQGVERYRVGDYRGAIALWETALAHYQKAKNRVNTAIVLENLARAYQQIGQSEPAIAHWQKAVAVYRQMGNLAQVGRMLTEQAQVYSSIGQSKTAIALLCKPDKNNNCTSGSALQLAQNAQDPVAEVAALGSLGDAYRLTGNYNGAIAVLERSRKRAQTIDQPTYLIATLNSLGSAYSSRAQVNYRRANSTWQIGYCDQLIQQGLGEGLTCKRAKALQQSGLDDDRIALKLFQESRTLAQMRQDARGELRSLLNAIPLYYRTNASASDGLQQATRLLDQLPASRERVYATIDLARLQQPLTWEETGSKTRCLSATSVAAATGLLKQAIEIAQRIGDHRAESFALGELGHLYECQKDYATALTLTQQARWAADQELQSKDSLYLWEWQTGRILKQQGNLTLAIAAYDRAIATLETIRGDILTANRDLQFDFRDTVDPLYRESVALRLRLESNSGTTALAEGCGVWGAGCGVSRGQGDKGIGRQGEKGKREKAEQSKISSLLPPLSSRHHPITPPHPTPYTPHPLSLSPSPPQKDNLSTILTTMDSLKLAELQNYFGNDCVLTAIARAPANLATGATATAVFSSIILDQQTAIVLSLPNGTSGGTQRVYTVNVDSNTLRQEITEFRRSLEADYNPFNPARAQKIYDWLIRPLAADLEQAGIKTLVFVQDGVLRSVPMAALHDGKQFLIEKYAIATTPSLSLVNAQPPDRQNLRALALGLTKSVTLPDRSFTELENVSTEVNQVKAKLPTSTVLLDDQFTSQRLEQELSKQSYPIIHIATHGEFGSDPEDTFLVTGDEQKLTINQLDAIIRRTVRGNRAVDLLTLTACQTAVGDDRSALGLAGVAIQAGVSSALASLWFVDDAATAQIATQFYAGLLNPNLSKAEALRAAQTAQIAKGGKDAHPAYWAPFILVGNWL